MNARAVAILVVLLAALGGGALLVRQQSGSQQPAQSASLGQPLFKGLQAAEVASVVIRQPKAAITIARKDERWTIAERGGFPADFDKVRDFVLKAIALKISQAEPIGEKDRARLELDAGGTAVEFLGADGKPLARLTVGRKFFKSAPENPDKAIGDGRYVALPGDEQRVYVVADPLTQASARSADWISKAGIGADQIKSLDVQYPEGAAGAKGAASGPSWRVERTGDNADWKLAGARADEKLELTKANAAVYTFGQIEIADVAPPGARPEAAGLDRPAVVTASTFDGLTYVLKLGKSEGDNVYASVAVAGEPKAEGKDAEERQKKLAERLARERALAGHIVLIPKQKLDDIVRKRADLLAKKEEKKK
ncbi:MAG: DUF4340 domain-containing protein [Burkholderiales bacterium]